MIGWIVLSVAQSASDPDCALSSCPAGSEAKVCSDDFEGRGDCFGLLRDGWERACKLEDRDKAWTLVVCRAPRVEPPPPAPSACGCAAAQTSPVPWMAVLAGVALRRRR